MRSFLTFLALVFTFFIYSQSGVELDFSVNGGLYDENWNVELIGPQESNIYYTLDGSTPNRSSYKYKQAIPTDSITIIRAVAYYNGEKSAIKTASYFSNRKHSLPVVSIVTDAKNLWDFSTGIYVKGCCADSIPPYVGANFWKGWERPCNIEMYLPNNKLCLNQQAGIRIFGGFSKMLPQKSFALVAREKYGSNKFNYPLFKERKHKSYKTFILRNSGGDFRRTQLRDAFMTQLAKPTGIAIQAYEPVVVYLNGKYWGILNLREKLNEHYLTANFNVKKNEVDLLKHNAGRQHGSSSDYRKLISFLNRYSLSDDKWVDSLSKFMDIQDFITYNICETYSQNQDAGGNIRYFKARIPGARWKWILFDMDMGLANTSKTSYKENTLMKFTTHSTEGWPNPSWSTFIIRSLLANENLKLEYINTFCDYLNTVFHPNTAVQLLEKMSTRIAAEIPYHQKRWASKTKYWYKNIELIKTFLLERPKYLYMHLQEKFLLEDLIEITVKLPEGDLCKVKLNSLILKEDFKGRYFNNIPLKVSVETKHDYEFVGWKNLDNDSQSIIINPKDGLILEPIIQKKQFSTFVDSVFINEISFSQISNDSLDDWIEIYNNSSQSINLNGWSITKSKYNKGQFLGAYILNPNSFLLIARSDNSVIKKYNIDTINVLDRLKFGLSKQGEKLKLYDVNGFIVDELIYKERYADSAFTIGLIHLDSVKTDEKNWLIQSPTPLNLNSTHIEILKQEEIKRLAKQKKLIIIASSVAFVLLLVILLIVRGRRKKRAKVI